ncbi:MAG TPA: L-aspartate oxidase [Thermococcaceae archaeon]|uniref:L-aspartate oxidase n=2 Tax=Thermococcus sibiricus TaxID=172049 RepID=C6A0H9_THESM|nr:L-aspartate oxidase [Thermococcus sibiricus]ACS89124.1 Quinolinate synthetase B [Thermococcus sibiricus MM 739]KUK18089.1 MAG: Quinolinate synthetase B [Thermococcus sibiricus]KUK27942.1 MAG: Quinolinate synthetase B [Thermococcus sp. 40_45]HII67500.1 L-aspartate oxidase [Thermococcaceae archaeon]
MKVGIIGNGTAGLTAAISLAKKGNEVYIVGDTIKKTNSYLAQAGIAFPILDEDSIRKHVLDTINAGRHLNNEETVWSVISKSSEAYDFLLSLGLEFEGNEIEGGHSFPRVFTIKNETGKHIIKLLYMRAKELGVQFIKGLAESVAIKNKKCYGVFLDGEFLKFDATVLATGGYTALFKYTAGSPLNLGTLIGDTVMKGALARDLEFVQFHPTGFIGKNGIKLISEAVRGAGAKLINSDGERFINELEPRDIVARAIYMQTQEGKEVYLDATDIEDFKSRFPQIYAFLKQENINPKRDMIPISPIAHYSIGGLSVDTYYRTNVENLYAIGEAADNGFHGANRLASNSLLECIVSGLEVSRTIFRERPKLRENIEPLNTSQEAGDVEQIREVLWKHAGIVRSGEKLKEGIKKLKNIEADKRIKCLAEGILKSALWREESRGVHYRVDFPFTREEFKTPSFWRC